MGKRWFASLNKGIGWKPATWQGWIILASYTVLVVSSYFWVDSYTSSLGSLLLNFILLFLIETVILSFICYITGEKPKI